MGFAITYGVVMRYAFHAPEPYSYEFSAMFLLFSGVLAVAGVERLDRNVRNDLISTRYPPLIKVIVLSIIFPLLALLFVGILTWKSVGNALYALQIGQISASPWAVPLAPIKFVIPFGYILLCLILIGKFIQGFTFRGCLKYAVQGTPLTLSIRPTNMFKHKKGEKKMLTNMLI